MFLHILKSSFDGGKIGGFKAGGRGVTGRERSPLKRSKSRKEYLKDFVTSKKRINLDVKEVERGFKSSFLFFVNCIIRGHREPNQGVFRPLNCSMKPYESPPPALPDKLSHPPIRVFLSFYIFLFMIFFHAPFKMSRIKRKVLLSLRNKK